TSSKMGRPFLTESMRTDGSATDSGLAICAAISGRCSMRSRRGGRSAVISCGRYSTISSGGSATAKGSVSCTSISPRLSGGSRTRSIFMPSSRTVPRSTGSKMPGSLSQDASLDLVAHVIQVALTPIFLLSGIATLLNVFATRLARVADLVAQITKSMEQADPDESADLARQLLALRRRSIALDAAIVLGAIAAAATCASVFTLFVGALRNSTVASVLFTTFGLAIVCTISAIMAFTTEMMMAGSGVRAEVARQRSSEQV